MTKSIPAEVLELVTLYSREGDEFELKWVKSAQKWVIVISGVGHISIDQSIIDYRREKDSELYTG